MVYTHRTQPAAAMVTPSDATVAEVSSSALAEALDAFEAQTGRTFSARPGEKLHFVQMLDEAGVGSEVRSTVADAMALELRAATLRPIDGRGFVPPFYDLDAGRLGHHLLEQFFVALGWPPALAEEVARFFAAQIGPERFYRPMFEQMGGRGPFDMNALMRAACGQGNAMAPQVRHQVHQHRTHFARRPAPSATPVPQRLVPKGAGRRRFELPQQRRTARTDPAAQRHQLRVQDPVARLDVDRARVSALAAELRIKLGDDDLDKEDVIRLRSLSSDERVAVMHALDDGDLKALGDQLPDTDDEEGGKLLAAMVRDAKHHPVTVRPRLARVLKSMDEGDDWDADDILRHMHRDLGGGDVSEEGNAKQAAAQLRFVGETNLRLMTNIHSEGNTDETELEVVGRARGQIGTGEVQEEVSELLAETTRKIGDSAVDGTLIKKLSAVPREERLAALTKLTSAERRRFVSDDGADHEDEMGQLMADLVKDAKHDPRALAVLADFVEGAAHNDDGDDVLQKMQRQLGGGDIDEDANRRRAARALSALPNHVLARMGSIHEAGWRDDSELKTLKWARALR